MKVETGELLSIGRFARLSGLTVEALRHYDAEGRPIPRAAVHDHRGPYEGLPAVYEPLREWIVANGLQPGEQTREVYPANPGNTADPRDYVTRVCWPVT